MSFLRKILTAISGPLALLFMLGVVIFGIWALFVGTILIATYIHITITVLFAVPNIFLIRLYFKDRKSMKSETSWKCESKTVVIAGL